MTATSGSKSGRGGRRPGAGPSARTPQNRRRSRSNAAAQGAAVGVRAPGASPVPGAPARLARRQNQAELFAEAFTSEPPIAASAKGPALGAYPPVPQKRRRQGRMRQRASVNARLSFFSRISNLLEPRDGNAIREIVDQLEAGTSFEQAIGLASDWRSRERNRMLRALASRGFSAGRIAKGLREGERGEFPAFAERIIRLDNGRTRCARQILNSFEISGNFDA